MNPTKINWRIFFLILFAPAIGCFSSMAVNLAPVALGFSLAGGFISGISCCYIIMSHMRVTGGKKVALCLFLVVGLPMLSYFLSFVGCALGGGVLEQHH